MKKTLIYAALSLFVAFAVACKKDSTEEQPLYPSSDYQLSADGKVLEKWLNPETISVDMQKDIKLREVTSIEIAAFSWHTKIKSVIISDKVTTISDGAFGNSALQEVTIPNSVTNLGERCFSNTNLNSVTIPGSIKNIPEEAFDSSSIRNLVISEGVVTIGKSTFSNCRRLENVSLPNSLTSIDNSAFFVCSALPTLTIPKNVSYLGNDVFFGCSSLAVINITPINPPTMGGIHLFQDSIKRINVPANSVDIYKTDPKWSRYASIIVAQP